MGYASGGGFRTLGAGLRGLGQRYGEIERLRAQDERQKMLDDERRAREALAEELMFVDRGGGVGAAPATERTLGAPMNGIEVPDFLPPPRTMGDDFLPPPDLGGKFDQGLTVSSPDPRYQNVGRGHVMKPGVREDMQRLEAEADIRRGFSSVPDLDPGLGDALATLAVRDVPIGNLIPDPNALSRDDRLRISHIDPTTNMPFTTGRGADERSRPTYGQAKDTVDDAYWIPGTDEFLLDEFERAELAQQLSRGEITVLPRPEEILRERANVPKAMAGYSPDAIARVEARRTGTATLPPPVRDTLPAPTLGDSVAVSPADSIAEQRRMWDAAAETLKARGQHPPSVIGPRP